MSQFFSYLPDVFVRSSSYRNNNVDPYVLAKNIFRRIKIREDLDDIILGFSQYTIQNNERPDQIAYDVYGQMEYDWVILLTNNIINIYDEWPMTEHEMYNYMVRKYGTSLVDSIHHWVTQEVKTPGPKGRIILKGGIQVPEDFTYRTSTGTLVPKSELVRPISNYDYESELNNYKRNIYLLRPEFVSQFIEEFEELVSYLPSVENSPDSAAKRSPNTVREEFIPVKPTYQSLVGQISSIDFATEQEFTSRTVTLAGASIEQGDVLADGSTVATTSSSASAVTESAGVSDEVVTNQYGSAGSSSGQTSSGSSSSSGGGY